MIIDDREFTRIDTLGRITLADSFVKPANKIGSGNGEGKLYIGNESTALRKFFGRPTFSAKCVMLREDLMWFLGEMSTEYSKPTQAYRSASTMDLLYAARVAKVSKLPAVIYFNIAEQSQIEGNRIYVNSDDSAYQLLRELPLPNKSYLSVMKMGDGASGLFYFKLFPDNVTGLTDTDTPLLSLEEEEGMEAAKIPAFERLEIRKARIGQGRYRDKLLKECPFCPVTSVNDDRLLIASHIKPWSVSNWQEKIDPKNGFMLTPTVDRLFDQGFITFDASKRLIKSPWISSSNFSSLKLADIQVVQALPIKGRENYLEYHRLNIFKK